MIEIEKDDEKLLLVKNRVIVKARKLARYANEEEEDDEEIEEINMKIV